MSTARRTPDVARPAPTRAPVAAAVQVRHPRAAVLALSSTALLASFLQTIMVPSVPELPAALEASAAQVQWVLTAALLAACATAPTTGRLGDLLGGRRVMVALLAVIVVGSLVGALSDTLGGVVLARALQGVGLGVMALNVSAVRHLVPPARLPAAMATVSACNGIGGGLGLPLSAAVSEHGDFHHLFWLAAGLAALTAVAVLLLVPPVAPTTRVPLDVPGAIGLGVGLAGVVLAVAQGADWGWASPATLGSGLGGLVVLVGWALHERRTPHPLVDLHVLTRRPVMVTNLLSVGVGFCWFGVPGVVTRLLETVDGPGPGLGLDMLTASLVVVPTGLGMLVLAPLTQRVVRRAGPRPALQLGGAFLAAAYLWAAFSADAPWELALTALAVGAGSALAFASLPVLVVRHVPDDGVAAANGIMSVSRWFGSTLSSAALGAVLATLATTWSDAPVPTGTGFRTTFLALAGVGVVMPLLATLLPRPPRA